MIPTLFSRAHSHSACEQGGLDLKYAHSLGYLAPSTGHGFIREQNKKAACRSDPFVDALLRDRFQVVQIEPAFESEFVFQDIFESNH